MRGNFLILSCLFLCLGCSELLTNKSSSEAGHQKQSVQRPSSGDAEFDSTPPTLTLLGNDQIKLNIGQLFIDPGVIAVDDTDGDVSHAVHISGNVNINREGIYPIIYSVTDSAGNQSDTETRLVEVELLRVNTPAYIEESSSIFDINLSLGPKALFETDFYLDNDQYIWDERGFNGLGLNAIQIDSISKSYNLTAKQFETGHFYIELERAGLSIAEAANTRIFYDSEGYIEAENEDLAAEHFIFHSDASTLLDHPVFMYKSRNHRLTYITNNWSHATQYIAPNSHVNRHLDPSYASIVVTWRNNITYIIVDGIVIDKIESDINISGAWERLIIGKRSTTNYLGNFFIKRFRLGNDFIDPERKKSSKRIALLGDSFVVSSTAGGQPENNQSSSAFEITEYQNALSFDKNYFNSVLTSSKGSAGWGHQLQAALSTELGIFQPLFNAAYSGHGWTNYPNRDTDGEIPHDFIEATVEYDPHIVIILGSVNDLLSHIDVSNADEDLTIDVDFLIDNTPSLQRIFLVKTFGWHHPSFTQLSESSDDGEAWINRYNRYNEELRALDGYRGKLVWVDHDWGATPHEAYLIGSATSNTTISAGLDFHPSATGHAEMANKIYPSLKTLIQAKN